VRRLACTIAVITSLAASAPAQEPTPAQEPVQTPPQEPSPLKVNAPAPWTVQFEPSGWYVAPGGRVRLPGAPASTPRVFVTDLNLDSPRWTPFGELHLRSGDWRLTLSGMAFSSSDRGAVQGGPGQIGSVIFDAGDLLTSTLDFTSVEASAAYTFNEHLGGSENFIGTIDALGGVRAYDVDFRIQGPAGSDSDDRFFAHPFVGAKVSMDIMRDFTIDVQLDLGYFPQGGGGDALGYEVVAGFQWRPTPNLGVQIGYRDLAWSLVSGSGDDRFDYTGALQGLYVGGILRF
jgi:hypothetical protein